MKTIRLICGVLLVLNGILHVFEYLRLPGDNTIGILVFGLLYFVVGLLLLGKNRYSLYLGIIVPIIGMTLSLVKFGIPQPISLSALFKVLGFLVVIGCAFILFGKKKSQ